MSNLRKLLLISSSRTHGTSFLEHAQAAIKNHLGDISRITFVPFALANRDAYARLAEKAFKSFGYELQSLHTAEDPVEMVSNAEAIFTGGGNTFRLLKTLYDLKLLQPIRDRIKQGMPYMGSSAGTNITCPTIRTTNDMPIVEPPSFEALNLVPFQINPHFIDANPDSTHQGETREDRLREFLEENDKTVIGIREGCWLNIDGNTGQVGGSNGGLLFRRDEKTVELNTGDSIAQWLN